MKRKRLADILMIAGGPLVVAWLYMFVLDCPDKPGDYLLITGFIILAAVATLGVSLLVYRFVRQRRRSTIISTVIAEVLYVVALAVLGSLDGTWFPIVNAVIMATFALPMAIGIAYGTGRIMSKSEAPTMPSNATSDSAPSAESEAVQG